MLDDKRYAEAAVESTMTMIITRLCEVIDARDKYKAIAMRHETPEEDAHVW